MFQMISKSKCWKLKDFTFRFCRFVVVFAQKLLIFHKVKFVTSIQFSSTYNACKAIQMIDIVLCSSYDIRWRNMSPTRSTFGPKFSIIKNAFKIGDFFTIPIFCAYLKKSSLQKTSLSRTKHFSLSGSLQWEHLRHFECHVLSRTLRMNRSRIRRPQPMHLGILSTMKENFTVILLKSFLNLRQLW